MKKFFEKVTPISSSLLKDKPLTFRGAISHWPALYKWTNPYLLKNIQNNNATNFYKFNPDSQRDIVDGHSAQSAFSKVIYGDSTQRYYLTRQPLLPQNKVLLEDIQIPNWVKDKKFYMPNMWVGQNMSLTPLHYDSTDGYLCQIAGYKRVYLFSPEDSVYLYSGNPLRGGQFNLSEITHVHDVSTKIYPHFLHATVHSILLAPGDALYIPQGWWHQIFNLNHSVAVNFFFTNEVKGYSPKQEILMYQACKTRDQSAASEIIGRRNYKLCFENALSLLKLNCIDYAGYFALTYFEEYLKAHLASFYFSKSYKDDISSNQTHSLLSSLYNSRQSDREKYYQNLFEANNKLKAFNSKAHIPDHTINQLIKLAKNILENGSKNTSASEIELVINNIKSTCIHEPDTQQVIEFDTNQYLTRN